MKQPKSNIPENAVERVIRDYREEGGLIYFRITECLVKRKVVGQRAYDSNGQLMMETPLRNGQKHGREVIWTDEGDLESVEPYVEGQLHGLAKQYGRNGRVIGTCRFVRGTGYDLWRCERQDGTTIISEIHSLQDSVPHGFEWWLNPDQRSVWHERHWYQGQVHGIERMWNELGRLKRGYPKYWIHGQAVHKRAYLKAAGKDETLPAYRDVENLPQRQFPIQIEIPA